MTQAQLDGAITIITVLLPMGITAATAISRAVGAIFGPELSEEEMAEKIEWLAQDATVRAALAHADAGDGLGD